MGKNNACLPNLQPFYSAGVDPKTGLPVRMGGVEGRTKENIKRQLRIKDEQNAINRYVWENLPMELSSQEFERLIYLKGQLCLFKLKAVDKFYTMPYALDGTIDFYGRFNTVHPVPMAEGKNMNKAQADLLSTIKLDVLYDIPKEEDTINENSVCVLVYDYSKQLSETIIPRSIINEAIIDIEAECIPYLNTALIHSTGVAGQRVNSEDEYSNVIAANYSIKDAALNQKYMIPIIGNTEFQAITSESTAKAEEFMQAMQSLDNYRLSLYGLDNGGVFEKKAHMLADEQEMNEQQNNDILEDGLKIRQRFCDIANDVWGLNITVRVNQSTQSNSQEAMEEQDDETEFDEQ